MNAFIVAPFRAAQDSQSCATRRIANVSQGHSQQVAAGEAATTILQTSSTLAQLEIDSHHDGRGRAFASSMDLRVVRGFIVHRRPSSPDGAALSKPVDEQNVEQGLKTTIEGRTGSIAATSPRAVGSEADAAVCSRAFESLCVGAIAMAAHGPSLRAARIRSWGATARTTRFRKDIQ